MSSGNHNVKDSKLPVSGSAMGWIIIKKTQPICKDAQYPIYYLKKIALQEAEKFGGTVHKVWLTW